MTAQTCTITELPAAYGALSKIRKVKFVWTCTDAGVVTGAETTQKYTGEIVRLITDPSATAPSDNYDIEVQDEDGYDVLMGAGANRDTANTEQVLASSLGVVYDSALTLEITGAGDAKGGTVILYIKTS